MRGKSRSATGYGTPPSQMWKSRSRGNSTAVSPEKLTPHSSPKGSLSDTTSSTHASRKGSLASNHPSAEASTLSLDSNDLYDPFLERLRSWKDLTQCIMEAIVKFRSEVVAKSANAAVWLSATLDGETEYRLAEISL